MIVLNTMIEEDCFKHEPTRNTSQVDAQQQQPLNIYCVGGCCGKYVDVMAASIKSVKRVLLAPKSKRKGPRGGVSEPFPSKLYDMLVGLESEGLTHIASWMDHGRCFAIARQDLFICDVMPRYFKQSKLTSFQRQMNLYGFQRVSSGVDKGCFYHPLFLRGRPDICKIMLRTRTKGNYGTITNNCDHEIRCESFYDLPQCPPTSSGGQGSADTLNLDEPEDSPRAVTAPSSPQVEPVAPTAIESNAFPLLPYATPAVPMPENQHSQALLSRKKTHSYDQRTPRDYQSSGFASCQAPLPSSVSCESPCSADWQQGFAPEYYNQSATDFNVVSPSYQTWTSQFETDDGVSFGEYDETFWGRTFQSIDDDEVDAYDRSLDRRYQPCQPEPIANFQGFY